MENHNVSSLILEIKDKIRTLTDEGKNFKLFWIPGHTGIIGNERADFVAKDAIRVGLKTQNTVPLTEIKNYWKNKLFLEFKEWCFSSGKTKGTSYFSKFFTANRKPWFDSFEGNRRVISSINRMRSGHSSLRDSLFRFRIVDSPLCLTCNTKETPNHVFWICPRFAIQRKHLFNDILKERGLFPIPLKVYLPL